MKEEILLYSDTDSAFLGSKEEKKMKTEEEIRERLKDNKYKIFPRGEEKWKDGYLFALEWVLGDD